MEDFDEKHEMEDFDDDFWDLPDYIITTTY